MRKQKGLLLIGLAVASLSSCTPLTSHSIFGSKEGGYVSLNADAEGMKAFSDWQTGTINEVRTPEGTKGSYYQLREKQEEQKTLRIKLPTLNKGVK